VSGAFADDVQLPFKRIRHHHASAAAYEHLPDHRLDFSNRVAESRIVTWHVAPSEQTPGLFLDRPLNLVLTGKP
jgi:hypothetical protein